VGPFFPFLEGQITPVLLVETPLPLSSSNPRRRDKFEMVFSGPSVQHFRIVSTLSLPTCRPLKPGGICALFGAAFMHFSCRRWLLFSQVVYLSFKCKMVVLGMFCHYLSQPFFSGMDPLAFLAQHAYIFPILRSGGFWNTFQSSSQIWKDCHPPLVFS